MLNCDMSDNYSILVAIKMLQQYGVLSKLCNAILHLKMGYRYKINFWKSSSQN